MTIGVGVITAIDHKTVDIEFFGHFHRIAPYLAIEFAEEILASAEEAKQMGPRCKCGHLVEDHGWFNGDSHPDENKETGFCGCVFSQYEAMSADTPKAEQVGMAILTGEHDTELDSAGWGGRARLTCHSCGETCLKQPYMNRLEWREKVNEFTIAHPSEMGKNYNESLAPLPSLFDT